MGSISRFLIQSGSPSKHARASWRGLSKDHARAPDSSEREQTRPDHEKGRSDGRGGLCNLKR
jgi:hypothetical protein